MRVKNWKTFQHYSHRNPPWIKLHKALLDDRAFQCLPVASRALAPMLWLLASENNEGEFDGSVEAIAFRLRMSEKEVLAGLTPLIDKGFFECASYVLAESKQVATTERETEREIEKEKALSGKPDVPPLSNPEDQKPKPSQDDAKAILAFLNEKTGRNYRPGRANLEFIVARLKEGATVAECRQVIAKKTREWGADEKMAEYLRPATLFNRTKFAQYQGELAP